MAVAIQRLWLRAGVAVRDARLARRWPVTELARRAGVSRALVYRVEAGQPTSAETLVRLVTALGLRLEFELLDPRRRVDGAVRASDAVHAAMGEVEAARLRPRADGVGMDEPYQHYQFAGRADVVAWHLERRALLHIENRTRFPDFQAMAGSYNAKRAYLGAVMAERLGIARWRSETHVIAALWSSEVLRALRRRSESFPSLRPDSVAAFAAWWAAEPPRSGTTSTLVLLDPVASVRQRQFIGLDAALTARARYRGYADAAAHMAAAAQRAGAAPSPGRTHFYVTSTSGLAASGFAAFRPAKPGQFQRDRKSAPSAAKKWRQGARPRRLTGDLPT